MPCFRLMERVSTEGWREAGAAFVGCVTRLLERLLDYRAVMQGAEHRDKRMAATVNLLVSLLATLTAVGRHVDCAHWVYRLPSLGTSTAVSLLIECCHWAY